MSLYFLSECARQRLEERGRQSFYGEDPRPGYFGLFNKNALETLWVGIIQQCPDRCGSIVECNEIPLYFQNVLTPDDYPE